MIGAFSAQIYQLFQLFTEHINRLDEKYSERV